MSFQLNAQQKEEISQQLLVSASFRRKRKVCSLGGICFSCYAHAAFLLRLVIVNSHAVTEQ